MIDKELLELQIGCKATCGVILNEDCEELNSKIIIDTALSDSELVTVIKGMVDNKLEYLVIDGIDEVSIELQRKYAGIVKDREFLGYNLPQDIIIVFAVKNKESLNKIFQELYHFCVVAF